MKSPARKFVNRVLKHESDVMGPASAFALHAFKALYRSVGTQGRVHQCSGHWADGYLEKAEGVRIAFEIKDTLGWGSLCSAMVQVVSINHALSLNAAEGWIIFGAYSNAWDQKKNCSPIDHARYCASQFHSGLDVKFVHLGSDLLVTPIHACRGAA